MTIRWHYSVSYHLALHYRKSALLQQLHIIAFTHRQLEVSKIGLLHIEKEAQVLQLAQLKEALGLKELMFLTTCNRVEITFVNDLDLDTPFLTRLLQTLYPKLVPIQLEDFVRKAEVYSASAAVQHALSVASSIDSMIIGEREIITQVRLAYEHCNGLQLTGDLLRLLIKKVIETAKQVYTETNTSSNSIFPLKRASSLSARVSPTPPCLVFSKNMASKTFKFSIAH